MSMQETEAGAEAPAYVVINKVECVSFSNSKERKRNMRWCMNKHRKIRRLFDMPMPKEEERTDIAIVAGGPSLNDTFEEVKKYKYIMTCGSVHDHAIKLGIKPTYHVECDPSHYQIRNYHEDSNANYLVSSRCNKVMFKKLQDRNVFLWHMWEQDLGKPIYQGEPAFVCGATVTLSAIPIAIALQFKHMHFFGFDSSFKDKEQHHAYHQPEKAQMLKIKVGDQINGKEFETTATWVGQAQQFEDMQNHWGFKSTFYGESLMAEIQRIRTLELAKENKHE